MLQRKQLAREARHLHNRGVSERLSARMYLTTAPSELQAIAEWLDLPAGSEAIRRLIQLGLKTKAPTSRGNK